MYKDKLDYLIALAAIGCGEDDVEMFNNLDTSKVVFDKSFYRIRDRRIRQYKRKPFVNAFKKVMSRVAVAVLAIISAGTLAVVAIPSLREALFGAIVEWYEDYLTINYEMPDDEIEETEGVNGADTETGNDSETTEQIVRPTKIEEVKKPTYYQEGIIEDIVVQSRMQVYIEYYFGENLIYSYKQLVFSEDDMYVNNESAVVQNIEINGFTAYLVELVESSHKKIIWTDGLYIYQLTTESSNFDLLIIVAESVK
ncbi:MAG: DUF4367 domain-containing protein [Clostridia bacterium]|nr:DUF4367 domain-containing protein [Clostridia bacterium]